MADLPHLQHFTHVVDSTQEHVWIDIRKVSSVQLKRLPDGTRYVLVVVEGDQFRMTAAEGARLGRILGLPLSNDSNLSEFD